MNQVEIPHSQTGVLVENLLDFVQVLRRAGLPVSTTQVMDFCRALTLIDLRQRVQVYHAARGILVTLCVPENVSIERKRILSAYGAEILWTDPLEGTDGAIRKAKALHAAEAKKYFYADQYSNDANWLAHYHGTANEIWSQTAGGVTHFVAGLGTSGTFMGTTRRLKELNSAIQAISLQPDSAFHGLEGLKHMTTALVPKIYDPDLADEALEVSTETAYEMVKRMARSEGVLIGISAGAALAAVERVAQQVAEPAVIVTILPDSADRYLSEHFWSES